jgi:oligopeptide/dipeptide ABC transporter ATP-binding protein
MSTLLEVSDLKVHYDGRRRGSGEVVRAVDGVSFDVAAGETLAIVGESGCGKSSVCNAVLRLREPTSGSVRFDDVDLLALKPARLRQVRRNLQVIFQDPASALNSHFSIRRIVEQPLVIHDPDLSKAARSKRVLEALNSVGLESDVLNRYPHEFSGGQLQRVCIARALITDPKLIVCDEPVSALDVSVQAQVINLLLEIQRRSAVSLLFISHDLAVVRQVADRLAVMYLGRIVESGPADQIFDDPQHPYTRLLLDSLPGHGLVSRNRAAVAQQAPDPARPPSGCHFHPRCPRRDDTACLEVYPPLAPISSDPASLRSVACHHPLGHGLNATQSREDPPCPPTPTNMSFTKSKMASGG